MLVISIVTFSPLLRYSHIGIAEPELLPISTAQISTIAQPITCLLNAIFCLFSESLYLLHNVFSSCSRLLERVNNSFRTLQYSNSILLSGHNRITFRTLFYTSGRIFTVSQLPRSLLRNWVVFHVRAFNAE